MSVPSTPSASATVTDHRPVPRGVLPRGLQTWLMVVTAAGMVLIIVVAGRPEPGARRGSISATPPPAPNGDHLREYQDRLRVLEARAAQRAPSMTPESAPSPARPQLVQEH